MRFTNRTIDTLRVTNGKSRQEYWEDNGRGLGIRVSSSGRKSWILLYRFHGKPRRLTLGTFPEIGIADAHQKREEALQLLGRDIDPGRSRRDAIDARNAAPTVTDLASDYIANYARPRKRSWAEDERILSRNILPSIGALKAEDVSRRDVLQILDRIQKRGAPIGANRTLAMIRKMFNYALGRDIVSANPCNGIPAPARERRRDRVLTDIEIRALWEGLAQLSMSEGSKLALQLELVTAQRKGEIISAEWAEFDLDNQMWTIPASKAKNGLAHRVPLSPLALQILAAIRNASSHERWLFPSPRGQSCVTAPSIDHAVRRTRDHLGISDFTPHDLRRTAASGMTSLGISRLVVQKILNHAEPGVTAVYDRHSYDREKRDALLLWATHLNHITGTPQSPAH